MTSRALHVPGIESPSIPDGLAKAAEKWPDNGYVFQDLDGSETFMSFVELQRETANRAASLQNLGLRKGDRLAGC